MLPSLLSYQLLACCLSGSVRRAAAAFPLVIVNPVITNGSCTLSLQLLVNNARVTTEYYDTHKRPLLLCSIHDTNLLFLIYIRAYISTELLAARVFT